MGDLEIHIEAQAPEQLDLRIAEGVDIVMAVACRFGASFLLGKMEAIACTGLGTAEAARATRHRGEEALGSASCQTTASWASSRRRDARSMEDPRPIANCDHDDGRLHNAVAQICPDLASQHSDLGDHVFHRRFVHAAVTDSEVPSGPGPPGGPGPNPLGIAKSAMAVCTSVYGVGGRPNPSFVRPKLRRALFPTSRNYVQYHARHMFSAS